MLPFAPFFRQRNLAFNNRASCTSSDRIIRTQLHQFSEKYEQMKGCVVL